MRLSKFNELMNDEFGVAYSQVLLADLVLGAFGDKTGAQAIAAGIDPRDVWLELCKVNDVPRECWHGRLKPVKPKQ
jgi:hypothetical protein